MILNIIRTLKITKNLYKMSTKNHTKNQLVRISAKIQQLKQKYPPSSELYQHNERQKSVRMDNALQQISLPQNQQSYFDTKSTKLKSNPSILKNLANQQVKENNFNIQNDSMFAEKQLIHRARLPEERISDHNSQKSQHFSQQHSESFDHDFICQKPLHQYKQELKHLKKQILSSLDISNFEISKFKQQISPKINKEIDLLSKKQIIPKIPNQVYDTFNRSFGQNQYDSFVKVNQSQLYQNKNAPIEYISTDKSRWSVKQNVYSQQGFVPRSQYQMMLQRMSQEIRLNRQEMSQRLQRLQFQSHSLGMNVSQTRIALQEIQQKIATTKQQKLSEYDLKIVQIQNQSITKLSKQLYKEIQSINAQLNNLKCVSFSAQKQQFKEQIYESVMKCIEEKEEEKARSSIDMMQQVESKFFRQIFDLKNQIQLVSEKIKKEEYLEKTLKSLMSTNTKPNQEKTEDTMLKVKAQLQKDTEFLNSLKKSIQPFFQEKLESFFDNQVTVKLSQVDERLQSLRVELEFKISESGLKIKGQISSNLLREIGFVSNSLREYETKTMSYGILIEHLEEALKQLSDSFKEIPNNNQLFEQFRKTLQNQVTLKVQQKFKSFKYIFQSKSFEDLSKKQKVLLQTQNQNYSLKPLTQQNCSNQNDHSQVSIFASQEVYNDFWLTNIEEKSNKKLYEVNIEENIKKEKNQSFSLDQLVKNSSVFSALND